MSKFISFRDHKARLMKNPEFKAAYDALGPEYDLISAIIRKRIEKKMTQGDLARKMGTKQSAISRLESGNSNPSLQFMQKIAHAFGSQLHISFQG